MARKPRVLLPENLGAQQALAEKLRASGFELVAVPSDLGPDAALKLAAEVDAVVCHPRLSCRSAMIERARRLRAVVSTVIGVDHIDVVACSERGIIVANGAAPENFLGMAEATVLAILAVTKELNRKQRALREGRWRPEPMRSFLLRGRTLGLIGFGRIGRGVAARLQGWEMRILAYDPYVPREVISAAGVEPVDLETLLRESDIVSIHVLLTPETRGMIGARELALMRPGSAIINNSRGGVVDEAALAQALQSGHLLGAAVDTFETEPVPMDNPLLKVDPDRVILTGHCIGHGIEVYRALVETAVKNLKRAVLGETPLYTVNPHILPAWRERIARLDRDFGPLALES